MIARLIAELLLLYRVIKFEVVAMFRTYHELSPCLSPLQEVP